MSDVIPWSLTQEALKSCNKDNKKSRQYDYKTPRKSQSDTPDNVQHTSDTINIYRITTTQYFIVFKTNLHSSHLAHTA